MKRLLIFTGAVLFFSEGFAMCNEALSSEELKIMQKAYSGNPLSENLKTYVYLCRKSAGSDKCSDSDQCNGLSVAFITTDGEFCGFEPGKTANVVWSASTNFRDDGFFINYVYNYAKYRDSGDDKIVGFLDKDGVLRATGMLDSLEYLHNADGSRCVSKSVSTYYTEEEELRIVKTLKSALFRWEIFGMSLSKLLMHMGELGEYKEIGGLPVRVIPKYGVSGSNDIERRDNCATFSARIISKIVGIEVPTGNVLSEIAPGVLGLGLTTWGISVLPVPGARIVAAGLGLMGLIGGATLLPVEACVNTPNGVINTILGAYCKSSGFIFDYESSDGLLSYFDSESFADFVKTYEETEKNFRIVAHNEEEARENYRKSEYGDENNRGIIVPYNEFELKSVKQAIDSRLRMSKLKREGKSWWKKKKKLVAFLENIFLKSDFDRDSVEQSFSDDDSVVTLVGDNWNVHEGGTSDEDFCTNDSVSASEVGDSERKSGASSENSDITVNNNDLVSTLDVRDADSLTAEYDSVFYLDKETDLAVSEDELCSFLKQAGFEEYSDDDTLVTEYSDYYLTEEDLYESEDEYSLFFDKEIRPYLIEDDVAA